MFLEVLIISAIVGLVRGGRPASDIVIKCRWLLVAALVARLVASFIPDAGPILCIVSYVCVITLGVVNAHSPGFRILTVGAILNAATIFVNGGRMPVVPELARQLPYDTSALFETNYARHVAANAATPLAFLGDVILLRYPVPRVSSLGDMFAAAGAFVLIQELLGKPVLMFGPAAGSLEGGINMAKWAIALMTVAALLCMIGPGGSGNATQAFSIGVA